MPELSPSSIPGARALVARVDRAMRWRADEQIGLFVEHLTSRLDEQDQRLADLSGRLDQFGERLDELTHDNFWTAEDVRRVAPQVAALDMRLEDLRQSQSNVEGTPEQMQQARNIVDEVRREHAQVRSRLTAVAWYEDRLRKLEDQLASLKAERVVEGTPSALAEEAAHGADDSVDIAVTHGGEER
ncbi:MAG: hypothetical protein WKF73_16040 [Nocardioidaceae bacterium]